MQLVGLPNLPVTRSPYPTFNKLNENVKTAFSQDEANSTFGVRDKRFDIFVDEINGSCMEKLNKNIHDTLKHIMCLGAEDRRSVAYTSKEAMKSLIHSATTHEEDELAKFKDLKEQKAYYQKVIDDQGYVREGKFELTGKSKGFVSLSEVEKLLDEVQEKINDIVTAKAAKNSDPLEETTLEYLYSAAMFRAATNIGGSKAFEAPLGSLNGKWSRTEDNFERLSQAAIDDYEKRAKELDRLYRGFLIEDEFGEDVTNAEKERRIGLIMESFEKWEQFALLKEGLMTSEEKEKFNEKFDYRKSLPKLPPGVVI